MNTFTTTLVPSSRGRCLRMVGLAALLTLGLVACGDDDDDDTTSDAGDTETEETTETTSAPDDGDGGGGGGGEAVPYEVTELSYQDVSAPAGGTIEITNTSGAPHTFTSDDGSFDADFGADGTATVDVPAEPGEYPFHCEIHSSMQATLTAE